MQSVFSFSPLTPWADLRLGASHTWSQVCLEDVTRGVRFGSRDWPAGFEGCGDKCGNWLKEWDKTLTQNLQKPRSKDKTSLETDCGNWLKA